jgi:hypothetical protein
MVMVMERMERMAVTMQDICGMSFLISHWITVFSGDQIFDYMGNLGFGALMTCRQDCLPTGIPEKYL